MSRNPKHIDVDADTIGDLEILGNGVLGFTVRVSYWTHGVERFVAFENVRLYNLNCIAAEVRSALSRARNATTEAITAFERPVP